MMAHHELDSEAGFGAGVQKRVLKATAEGLAEATGTEAVTLQTRLMREVLDALWIPCGLPEDEQSVQLDAAYALMREIAPRDAMEGLLTAQMAGIHGAAMDCLRRAMQPGQSDEVRDSALALAARLLTLYPRQMEALDRRRGRGSHHTLTVRRVTVAEAERDEPVPEPVAEPVRGDAPEEEARRGGDAAAGGGEGIGGVRERAERARASRRGEPPAVAAQGAVEEPGRQGGVLPGCEGPSRHDPPPDDRRARAA